ncbi:hypothetical protein PENSPDRAFT_667708 [Peniophora sp. CONT]|nr:hypothetical protein PENSPDRAFT_667708 [Peniophora sp. CONT]
MVHLGARETPDAGLPSTVSISRASMDPFRFKSSSSDATSNPSSPSNPAQSPQAAMTTRIGLVHPDVAITAPISSTAVVPLPSTASSSTALPISVIDMQPLSTLHNLVSKFLDGHRDAYGARQSALWLFTNWGRTVVSFNTIIYHRLQMGVDCYAEIINFVARSKTEVLFQTKLLGWQTPGGWHAQTTVIFSYVIVPLVRCHSQFAGPGWSYFIYEDSLQRLAKKALHSVKLHLGRYPLTRLDPGDHITGSLVNSFMRSPALHAFETHLGTGMTVAVDDVHLPLKADMIQPPFEFQSPTLTSAQAH